MTDHPLVQLPVAEDRVQLVVACAQTGVIRRLRFEHQAHLVEVLDVHVCVLDLQHVVVGVDAAALRHKGADAAAHLHKPARRQDAERFAQRRAADVQLRGELRLAGQLVARTVTSVRDHFGKIVRNAHGQRVGSIGHRFSPPVHLSGLYRKALRNTIKFQKRGLSS